MAVAVDPCSDAPLEFRIWFRLGIILTAYSIVTTGVVFLAAGTFAYPAGWTVCGVFLGLCYAGAIFFGFYDPALTRRRIHAGPFAESRLFQRIASGLGIAYTFLVFTVSPLLFRWGIVHPRFSSCLMGYCLVVIAWIGIYAVLRQNKWAAATVRIEKNQQLVSTGLYSIVRHPMYAFSFLYFLGLPLAFGDYFSPIPLNLVFFPMIALRIVDEEKLLLTDLEDYPAYCKKVRYRLLPGVW